ncbi:MAG TPA: class I tRNA ligase family protein, partial [Rhodanobacteraceae bacterium]|nr:class I tRNA ligase family protein [Rhodanobacteraceae bacterium]
ALVPFSTLGWPAKTIEQDLFLPSTVLVTGYDIIFFWVARMIMMTTHFTGKVPFGHVYIHGLVRDSHGHKMSKSEGNVLDPVDLIDGIALQPLLDKRVTGLRKPETAPAIRDATKKEFPQGIPGYGADALRFTFAALATYGRTINFDLKRADGYKNFCNKLWNAARFVLMNTEGMAAPAGQLAPATEAERWILTRLGRALADVEAHFATYRFDLLAQALYEFTWNEFCDWFVELSKPALNGGDAAAAASTRHTLLVVLETLLRALHPVIPFITEEIWHEVTPRLGIERDTISVERYPRAQELPADAAAEGEIEWLKSVLTQIRRIRSEMNIAPTKPIPLLFTGGNAADRARATKFASPIEFLARAESQHWLESGETEPAAAAAILGELKLLIPLAGLIDIEAEKARLAREITRIEGEIEKSTAKLERFGPNTPAAVVDQEKQRVTERASQVTGLRDQLAKLASL